MRIKRLVKKKAASSQQNSEGSFFQASSQAQGEKSKQAKKKSRDIFSSFDFLPVGLQGFGISLYI